MSSPTVSTGPPKISISTSPETPTKADDGAADHYTAMPSSPIPGSPAFQKRRISDLLLDVSPSPLSLTALVNRTSISDEEKRRAFDAVLLRASSNGDADLLEWMLHKKGAVKGFVDPGAKDEDGVPAIVLASCFGHGEAVRVLVEGGASVDATDKSELPANMFSTLNPHAQLAFWSWVQPDGQLYIGPPRTTTSP
jgi:hypothetical protein